MSGNLSEVSSSTLSLLSDAKGNYTLLFFIQVPKQIAVGKLGSGEFKKGYYAYTGSAFGKGSSSLGGRILRHVKKQKTRRWHIDYLLSDADVCLKVIVAGAMGQKMECAINRRLRDTFHAQVPLSGFGSSDCKEHCGSHLLYLGQTRNIVERIIKLYSHRTDAEIFVFRL